MSVEIDALPTTKPIGWADALIARLGAGHIGNANRMTHSANGAASAPPVAITGSWFVGGSATTTKPQLLVEAAGATSTGWSTAGTGLGINAASGFTGNLIDAQVNGASKFIVDSSGIGFVSSRMLIGGTLGAPDTLLLAGITSKSTGSVAWTNSSAYGTQDVILLRDAANALALRNAANAQTFNIYNTYTSGSVYERGFMRWASNVLEIGAEHLGATQRDLNITSSTSSLKFSGSGIVMNGATAAGGNYFTAPSTGGYAISLRAFINSPAAGVINLTGWGATELSQILLGGTTSAFPSLKRSTTKIQARLADDSAFCNIQGQLQTAANAVAETPTATHTILIRDATGTAYRVLCLV